jgi:hypothetical protein
MKNIISISESEKKNIRLMHESLIPKRYLENMDNLSVYSLVNKFIDELNFQKQVHLHHISMIESNQRINYLKKIQDDYVSGLFSHNGIIYENYLTNIKMVIVESEISFSEHITKFNNFLVKSLMFDNGIISEQSFNPAGYFQKAYDAAGQAYNTTKQVASNAASQVYNTSKKVAGQVVDAHVQAGKAIGNQLSNAVDHLNKMGIDAIFENIRTALLGYTGTAVQIALSFTGAGAILTEVVWAIMSLYDAYQYFVNKKPGSLTNLVIDLICLLTAGTIGKILGKFVGVGATSIKEVFSKFGTSVMPYLKPLLEPLKRGIGNLSSFLQPAVKFMKDKMGINWAANLVDDVIWIANYVVEVLAEVIGQKAAPLVAKGVAAVSRVLPDKLESRIFAELAKKSEQELTKMAGETVTQAQIKAAQKYAEEYLQQRPTQYALDAIDVKFGTKMGNLYRLYVTGSKLKSHTDKVTGGKYTAVERGTDLLRGNVTATSKATDLSVGTGKNITSLVPTQGNASLLNKSLLNKSLKNLSVGT